VTLGDRAEIEILKLQLTSRCSRDSQGACGFQIVTEGQLSRLTKTIQGPNRQSVVVSLDLVHSSHSESDLENRSQSNLNSPSENQLKASIFARSQFLNGFRDADVLTYLGHARAGGGPDFLPPQLKLNGNRDPVDYSKYRDRKSFQDMVQALSQSPKAPKVLALFACKSASLFASDKDDLSRELRSRIEQQGSLFIGSSNLTDSNSDLGNYIGLIDGLLNMRCGPGFSQGMQIERAGNTTEFIGQMP
jgi:hypothetical protein